MDRNGPNMEELDSKRGGTIVMKTKAPKLSNLPSQCSLPIARRHVDYVIDFVFFKLECVLKDANILEYTEDSKKILIWECDKTLLQI